MRAVGVVRDGLPRTSAGAAKPRTPADIEGRIEIFPEYADALDGLEAFSHAFVLAYLHALPEGARETLKVVPRPLREAGHDEDASRVGVFATHSPARPNPIGLTLVRILRRDGNTLFVRGLDLYDGTPVLDSMSYTSGYAASRRRVPGWAAGKDGRRRGR